MTKSSIFDSAAYGGSNWSPRTNSHRQEIGTLWGNCGVQNEWGHIGDVLMHTPGAEWDQINDPDAVQMHDAPNLALARQEHLAIAQAYRDAGASVHFVEPNQIPPPNLTFCADLFFMTPEGAILARPASTVRAGEERWIARRLADLGIPVLSTLRGRAVFEGADAQWITPKIVLIGRGLRTNQEAIRQITHTLGEIGVEAIAIDLPLGTMHLMGIIRFLTADVAVIWPHRLAFEAVELLKQNGYQVLLLPDEDEASNGSAFNFVTLGPKEILIAAGNPKSQAFYESQGVTCHTVVIDELSKAAGGIGCMTGIIQRRL